MATTMETNLAVMKAVTEIPYAELVAIIQKHYPMMFDMMALEKEFALQGLGLRNNLALYLTVVNTLGVKDQFVAELTGCGRKAPELVDADSSAAAGECDLESDPSYTIGFTCSTTRSCVFDIERNLPGPTECYEYIGNQDDEDDVALAVDVTTQNNADISDSPDAPDTPTASAKTIEALSEKDTEPSEQIAKIMMDKCVLDGETEGNGRRVVTDDD